MWNVGTDGDFVRVESFLEWFFREGIDVKVVLLFFICGLAGEGVAEALSRSSAAC
jgi:hypothetical protein